MRRVRVLLELVKFEHTVFALPFVYVGMILAANGWAGGYKFVWITLAMAGARTFAFAVNRLVDRGFDARNPRTLNRALPRGAVARREVVLLAAVSLTVLVVSAWRLNGLVLALLPGAVIFLVGYSYTKRFTWLSHWLLGITDGMAGAGAWAAVSGSLLHSTPWLLWLAVTVWMAGFDIIYACQDVTFDRGEGLFSYPARFGVGAALAMARWNHLATVLVLAVLGAMHPLGWLWWIGCGGVTALLWWENSLVKPDDLSRVNMAFFTVNGYISLLVLASAVGGLLTS